MDSLAETINKSVEQTAGINDPDAQQFHLDEIARGTWLSTAVICFMAATLVALFWFPVRRMLADVEVNYNEGWNAYQAARVASGTRLYATPPQSFATGTGYPPLSFHLIAALGSSDTFKIVGRLVSLVSLATTGVLIALIVSCAGGSRPAAIFSLLLYEIAIALMLPDRIGMDDPQLLAEALSVAGLYFYIRNPVSVRPLLISALLFCLAGFTKQTLLAFPAAVAVDLLFRSRKRFVIWMGAMVAVAGGLLALTFLIDGRYFFVHLMSKRAYDYHMAWDHIHRYVLLFQGLLVIATAWSISAFRSHRFFVLLFILSNALAGWFSGGAGVDMNVFFSALAATAMACGLALSDIRFALTDRRPGVLDSAATLMVALLFIGIMFYVPGQLRRDRQKMHALPGLESEFRSSIELMKASPGPALCESLLLCYEAGKPFEYEPYSVRDQINTGLIRENDVLQLLKTHHFQTIQIALRKDEADLKEWADLRASLANDQTDPDKERRFTPNFMKELLTDYHLSKRTSEMALFSAN